jgi:transcriptional regulator with XRE-family HTH domain
MPLKNLKRLFGQRVSELRRREGISQEQLAEKIQRSRNAVSSIERGEKSARIETIGNIASALNVALPELFNFSSRIKNSDSEQRQLIEKLVKVIKTQDEKSLRLIISRTKTIISMEKKKKRRSSKD